MEAGVPQTMSVWHDRVAEASGQSFKLWLDLLRFAEAHPDDSDPARLLAIAQCQEKLGWHKMMNDTLDRLGMTGDPAIEFTAASLRLAHSKSPDDCARLRKALDAFRQGSGGVREISSGG